MKNIARIVFSTLLFLSISWQCTAKSIIYFRFKYNQEKLAETVCENKDKPGSCCKAKCYLDKEIKKEEKRQSNLPSTLKDKTEKSELFSGIFTFSPLLHTTLLPVIFQHANADVSYYYGSVFHPPTTI